ncbi:hypothetical protein [Castellaniella caeni]|uniref:hypothetical protein n=1 Tax=Castellaniella caeni TaxID=266123 RepID=UPI0015E07D6A|nr:hypothetical protein [Castellaniella caeni]
MRDVYVPVPCLAAARQVLANQNPDAARLAEQRWPGLVWRAAVKAAMNEKKEAT